MRVCKDGIEMTEKEMDDMIKEMKDMMDVEQKLKNRKEYHKMVDEIIQYTRKAIKEMNEGDLTNEQTKVIAEFKIKEMNELSELLYVLDKIL